MAGNLTDAKLRNLSAPEAGQAEYPDDAVPGLRARIGRSGKVSFVVRKRFGKSVRVITLGQFGTAFGIKEARRKARSIISDIEAGRPVDAPKVRPASDRTLRVLFPEYLAARKDKRRAVGELERIWRKCILPVLGDRMLESITRGDVRDLIKPMVRDRPAMARNVRAELSAFYGKWALAEFDEIKENPCRDAPVPEKGAPRSRVLADDELAALWRAAEAERWPWGPGVQLLMLTAARRSEVFGADWGEFDLVAGEWIIPAARSKNKRDHLVPLSPQAVDLLRSLPVIDGSSKVFPTRKGGREGEVGASGFSKATARIKGAVERALEREDGEQWQLHDIRRTVATRLQKMGVKITVTEAVLNHVSGTRGGIVGVYQTHDFAEEKRVALEAWADQLVRIVGGQDACV
jgi:integrase